jgi:hypothetical protein
MNTEEYHDLQGAADRSLKQGKTQPANRGLSRIN